MSDVLFTDRDFGPQVPKGTRGGLVVKSRVDGDRGKYYKNVWSQTFRDS